ncbi:MAG: hypothetical protein ACOC32_03550 [Nanoarchaeota archaeon]
MVRIAREFALYISKVSSFKYVDKVSTTRRIYFGTEFCSRAFPSPDKIWTVMQKVKERDLAFTLVLPWQLESFQIDETLDLLPKGTEVVLSDFGQLEKIKQRGLKPVLGRLLLNTKRDPRILPETAAHQKKTSLLDHDNMKIFLRKNLIGRVEIDNFPFTFESSEFKTSLYFPYVCISVSRKCLAAFQEANPIEKDYICQYECKTASPVKATIEHHDGPLIYKGNGLFYMNKEKPSEEYLRSKNVDRFVFMPEIPY